ncbi:ribonuclease H-like domain-containing protein, partial [Tanacetum coccineum]
VIVTNESNIEPWKNKRQVAIEEKTIGQLKILPPKTAEEVVARERERKARTTLLMAIPEDHLAKFHKMTDAKEMWNAIKSRFGGNDESKKMQKYILKQQFEGFTVSNTDGIHKGYERFQSLLSQLEIHGAGVSTEDANQKFLRSLPSAWFTTFVSENTSSTNDVSTAYGVSNTSGHNSKHEQTSSYSLLNKGKITGEGIDEILEIKMGAGTEKREESRALVTVDGESVDWTTHSEDDENFAFMASNSSGSDTQVPTLKTGNYLPSGPDIEIDDSQYTYGPRKSQPSESESQTTELDTCDSNTSTEPSELVSEPVVNESYIEVQPKVWSDAPIIEEYESDSDDEQLPDENQILLKVPRQNNMYSFNLENIVPLGGLACLIAKATTDESNKWHRRFSWTFFLRTKDETSAILKDFIRQIENQLNQKVKTIRCDNGTEFKNRDVIEFCGLKGIKREYSNARTPQQNGVAERKNRTLIEAARTMLADSFLPNTFWAEAVSTACYVLNSYIRPFGCHVTILNTIDHLGKFAGKSDEGFLVGYSLQSKAFRVYNLETKRVEENLHINFLENKPNVAGKGPTWLFDLDYLTDSMNYHSVRSENQANLHAGQQESNQNTGTKDKIDAGDSEKEDESDQDCFELPIWHSYSSTNTSASKSDNKRGGPREEEQVFLDDLARLQRQEKEANEEAEALLKNLEQETENLVTQAGAAKSSSTNIFSTVSTTAKASGTNLVNTVSIPVSTASANEGLSISDTTNSQEDDSEIPPLEDIHQDTTEGIFTHSSYDDEGAEADFTNLETVVNVSPIPTSRINPSHPSALILGDPTSAVQTRSKVNKSSEAHAFAKLMKEVIMFFNHQVSLDPKSMIGILMYVTASRPDLVLQPVLVFRVSSFDLESYSDSDYAGANLDRKSTTGGCQFLGRRLITWQCKKQTIVATSTTEAEYVAAASCCGQVLWIQNQIGSSVDERGKTHHGKSNLFQETPKPLCSTFQPNCDVKALALNLGITFVNLRLLKQFGSLMFALPERVGRCSDKRCSVVPCLIQRDAYQWSEVCEGKLGTNTAKVAGKVVSISEASIRTDLIFDDADGIDSLPNQAIFDAIQRMGYEGDLTDEGASSERLSDEQPSPQSCSPYLTEQAKPDINITKPYLKCCSLAAKIPKGRASQRKIGAQRICIQQGRKIAKGNHHSKRSSVDGNPEDKIVTWKQKMLKVTGGQENSDKERSFDEDRLSTEEELYRDFEKVSTDNNISTDGSKVSTEEQLKIKLGRNCISRALSNTTQAPTSSNICVKKHSYTSLNMSQAKLLLKKKRKVFELKDVEEIDRPRPTSTRSLLTLKPLLNIDPKDKGKKKIEEDDESETQRKFLASTKIKRPSETDLATKKQLRNQDDDLTKAVGNFNILSLKEFLTSQARMESKSVGSCTDSSGVHTLMTDEGLVVHMLIEKKYPLKKEIAVQMPKSKMESEESKYYGIEIDNDLSRSTC